MLLAKLVLPPVVIPQIVKELAQEHLHDIETCTDQVPFGAMEWVFCRTAWPHRDMHWVGCYFINLTIKGNHTVGDACTDNPHIAIRPGDLMIIDPRVVHWLAPHNIQRPTWWFGVQWIVNRTKAPALIRQLIAQYAGAVCASDSRYVPWVCGKTSAPVDQTDTTFKRTPLTLESL